MKPVSKLSPNIINRLSGIFFDIDDTFTLKGKIPAASFNALWALNRAGYKTVPITGRPAGWCDHIARMWPVSGVVGENGALYFHLDEKKGKLVRRFFIDPVEIEEKRERLKSIGDEILEQVPGTAYASDQSFRLFDVAIDFTEDVPKLSKKEIDKICAIFKANGVTYKVSSIHVNGWFGNYDKLNMTKIFSQEVLGINLDQNKDRFIFIGDSPNDEPMFRYFPNSVGVSNITDFLDDIKNPPAYIADSPGGEGFAEVADIIMSNKA
ncbi:MAG: HAD family phosphatase [Deltaproteobacteria bacterium]|uniref:HAD family phosphatase n=1 Tax=Candidatus Zymogenus saltonus TaxID=2844893 RepID=A0A9D8PRN3_9DELT|nr:HAD family phosphatase [Candidatus Zymogenus saltonus]